MANQYPNVNPGELVPGGTTYAFNARVVGDDLYIRDANGNIIPGRQVDNGDSIVVLDVGYTKQLVLVQYPSLEGIRQGYVTNATNIIQYINQGQWENGSTSETVYDQNDSVIGSLDSYEVATPLFRVNGKTNVVYNTSKGANTKSGYVVYEGGVADNPPDGITPGEIVPNGFSYGANAQVIGDDLYIRDANGTIIPGRLVSNGDLITVLDVGYTNQLALVQYPAGEFTRQGYVRNITSIIRYFKQGQWHNGSTTEEVLDETGAHLGSLDPYEAATPLYTKNGMTHVVYNTDKGTNTKSGYVRYTGSPVNIVSIPDVTVTGVVKTEYGKSGQNRPLYVHKIGSGTNSLVLICEVHGFEDNWNNDGIELVNIGNDVISSLASSGTNDWSVYVIPAANPDGLAEGYTNNGPGRCTVVGGVDINRDFPIGFTPYGTSRYWTGSAPLSVPESKKLSELLQQIKSTTSGQFVVLDLHGWQGSVIGNPEIGQYFRNQFGIGQIDGYGENRGFLIAWANQVLGAKAALIELPNNTYSHTDVVNGKYSEKMINAINGILSQSIGSIPETVLNVNGCVINVTSTLNVRNDASISSSIIGSLSPNENVEIIGVKDSWYKIIYGTGYGYVSKDYIKIEVTNTAPPDTMDDQLYWIEDALRRGWGPLTEEEYYKRINELFRNLIEQSILSKCIISSSNYIPSLSDYLSLGNAFLNNTTVEAFLDDKIYDTSRPGIMKVYQYDNNGVRHLVDEYRLKPAPLIMESFELGLIKGLKVTYLKGIDGCLCLAGVAVSIYSDLVNLEAEGYVHSNRDIAAALAATVIANGLSAYIGGILSSIAAEILAPTIPIISAIIGGIVGALAGYGMAMLYTESEFEEILTNQIEKILDMLFGEAAPV